MPSNLELKKSLEQTKKQLVLKDKEIADLNAQLSKFVELDQSSKVSLTPILEDQVSNKVDCEISPVTTSVTTSNDLDENKIKLKKKKRSLWNLYLW